MRRRKWLKSTETHTPPPPVKQILKIGSAFLDLDQQFVLGISDPVRVTVVKKTMNDDLGFLRGIHESCKSG